ncbi:MAG: hypothetical protein E7464_07755 [Ruminococcaceae bacterium]|nr:hypothetical protein [Oscillospiraceae bacterium]
MAFSDNIDAIKGYATNAAQTAVKKTKMLASVAKANIAILAEEEKIKKAQLELGKIYYKDFILDEEPDQAEYLPLCDKITESLKLIDNLKLEIALAREGAEAEEPAEAEAEAEPVPEVVVVEDVPVVEAEIVEEVPTSEAPAEEVIPAAEPVEDAPAAEE